MRYLGKFASHILPKGDWKHIFTKDGDHIMYMLPNTIASCIYFDARIEEFAVFKMDADFVMEPKHIEEFCSAITSFKKDIETQTIYDIAGPSMPTKPPLA